MEGRSMNLCPECARKAAVAGLVAFACTHVALAADEPPHVPHEAVYQAIVEPVVAAITTVAAMPPPEDVPSIFWDDDALDEVHEIALPSAPVAEPLHEPHHAHTHGDDAGPNVTVPLAGQAATFTAGKLTPSIAA
jgi:hypothetical protein